jgi:hypothetical protein
MRSLLAMLAVVIAVFVIGGLALIYSGSVDVAASAPHWPITRWVLETARTRSIKVHATGIEAPHRLDDPAKLRIGTEHFAAHCAVCHGAPGVPKGDIAPGLNPQPPDLEQISTLCTPAELFWIQKSDGRPQFVVAVIAPRRHAGHPDPMFEGKAPETDGAGLRQARNGERGASRRS